ncbi:hypothetical protein FHG87_024638 [Trinorchestia longiramus]|nr:hypothetical protein FHG87_024638 [Trinorchestia longiramus]
MFDKFTVSIVAEIAIPLLSWPSLYSVLCKVCPQLQDAPPNGLHCPHLPDLKTVVLMGNHNKPGTLQFSDVPSVKGADPASVLHHLHRIQFDSPYNIQFTSVSR